MGFIHKKTTIFFLTLLIMLNKGYSYLGVCSINYPSTAFYDCIVKNGYQNASILIDYTSNQSIINSTIGGLLRMKNSGLGATLGINFSSQNYDIVNLMIKAIQKFPKQLYDNIWLLPYYAMSNHNMMHRRLKTPAQNCQKLVQIARYAKQKKIPLAIATGSAKWATYYGNDCTQLSQFTLYWIPPVLDNKPSFDDFKPFAGWQTPQAKLHKSLTSVCGTSVFPFYFI